MRSSGGNVVQDLGHLFAAERLEQLLLILHREVLKHLRREIARQNPEQHGFVIRLEIIENLGEFRRRKVT